ncbi:MAG TPA: glycerophosphodiester phosphodiesterase family protein [Mycobacteriales bacterium]|nr:glycerophosphodiester phosphodiesterase family protein [Mycobacteriales bacterium]
MGKRPLVVAHRGSSYALAEHTLGAYLRALDEGADGLECDVRLTRDGHLVCVHDRTVDRTSSGHGVVSDFDLDDLNTLDFGSWHAPEPTRSGPEAGIYIEERDSTEAPVLTLERLLRVVAGTGVRLLVETKHPTRYAGLVEQQLVRLLEAHGMAGAASPVTVMSFSPVALRRVRLLAPPLPTVQLYRHLPVRRRDGSLPAAADVAGPSVEVLRAYPGYVRRVHRAGGRVFVWTVDEPADIELVLGLGVDAVITNRPRDVLARLGR